MLRCVQCNGTQDDRKIIKFHHADAGICSECLDLVSISYARIDQSWRSNLMKILRALP